ncbi:MAG: hypothetical protein J5725_06170 [Bacteroidales bacterium]|nr:hypothetical protein [Bacteroidales bacterium]
MTKNKDSTRYYSTQQEINVAQAIDGRRTPNSGATLFFKGDVVTRSFCLECKTQTKEKKSFSIQKEWIQKLQEEAFSSGKPNWAIAFNFGGEDQSTNYYIINEYLFKKLVREEDEQCKP